MMSTDDPQCVAIHCLYATIVRWNRYVGSVFTVSFLAQALMFWIALSPSLQYSLDWFQTTSGSVCLTLLIVTWRFNRALFSRGSHD